MNSVEDRLSELLHMHAPPSRAIRFDVVARRVRRRRRTQAASATAAMAAAVTGIVLAVSGAPSTDTQRLITSPAPTVSGKPNTVAFEGVTMTVPAGWTVAQPRCLGPRQDTVVLGAYTGTCPIGTQPALNTAVVLERVYGAHFALSWPGRRTTWQGQPAWLAEYASRGLTFVTLTLPWANTEVAAQSADPDTARSLVRQVAVEAPTSLQVPADARLVTIQSLTGRDGDSQARAATITDIADVRRLLADMRSLTAVTSPMQACDGSWWPSTALLTFDSPAGARTYAARFNGCNLVVDGTGSAARVSSQLLNDIRRLVPNSGL